jgi:hypothetical protein
MPLLVHQPCSENEGYSIERWEEIEPKEWKLVDYLASDGIVQIGIKFCPFCGVNLNENSKLSHSS